MAYATQVTPSEEMGRAPHFLVTLATGIKARDDQVQGFTISESLKHSSLHPFSSELDQFNLIQLIQEHLAFNVVSEEDVLNSSPFWFKASSILLFNAPETHLKKLNRLHTAESFEEEWKSLVRGNIQDWQTFGLVGCLVFSANYAFIFILPAYPPTTAISAVSAVLSMGSVATSFINRCQLRSLAPMRADAVCYTNSRRSYFLVLLHCLPCGLAIWSIMTLWLSSIFYHIGTAKSIFQAVILIVVSLIGLFIICAARFMTFQALTAGSIPILLNHNHQSPSNNTQSTTIPPYTAPLFSTTGSCVNTGPSSDAPSAPSTKSEDTEALHPCHNFQFPDMVLPDGEPVVQPSLASLPGGYSTRFQSYDALNFTYGDESGRIMCLDSGASITPDRATSD